VVAKTTCDNSLCSCDPCVCDECSCGVVKLGAFERRVMDVLWEDPHREFTGRDVAGALPEYAYTTLATVLDRLVHKGLVRRRMDGRVIRFTAIGTRSTHTAVLMYQALAVGGDPDPDAALVRFAETLTASEATVLRQALDGLAGKARRTRR
jgi:predicted transcriptional regulator